LQFRRASRSRLPCPATGATAPTHCTPRARGAWSHPNLARARRLVAQSRTLGERIEVWGTPDEGYIPPTVTAYVAGVLRTLGYGVRVRLVSIATVTQAMRTHFQLSADDDWVAPYPDASSYIPQYFSCGGGNGNGFYCSPRLDREMQQATQLEFMNPARSRALWESVDRQLTDDAVWVPTVTPRQVDLTSNRLHNYEYNPRLGLPRRSELGPITTRGLQSGGRALGPRDRLDCGDTIQAACTDSGAGGETARVWRSRANRCAPSSHAGPEDAHTRTGRNAGRSPAITSPQACPPGDWAPALSLREVCHARACFR
jgi:hypothetical protein